MSRTHTHTVATLEISHEAYDEIRTRLTASSSDEALRFGDGMIDMTGIGLVRFDASQNIGLKARSAPCDSDERVVTAMEETFSPDANTRQVGGTHYGLSGHQHWDIVIEHDMDYFQGQVTKYVMRWRKKNGIEDLRKAQHFLEKYIEEIDAGRITI